LLIASTLTACPAHRYDLVTRPTAGIFATSLKAKQLIPPFRIANAVGSVSSQFMYDVMLKKGSKRYL
jgi:hypothetical protein